MSILRRKGHYYRVTSTYAPQHGNYAHAYNDYIEVETLHGRFAVNIGFNLPLYLPGRLYEVRCK